VTRDRRQEGGTGHLGMPHYLGLRVRRAIEASLVEANRPPTVEELAKCAGISRELAASMLRTWAADDRGEQARATAGRDSDPTP